ncbi:Na+/H+ antiporter subunit E [Corynebacterium flavescens]|uniref:Na+/H+ antiporter subunit E n=1 Tax=Corynebacterium flavescens TaxID=28028 RepID=UPI0028999F69|nr:Na+/H+ antiporter subunit E [Corynebacterium flavescens]
MSSNRYGIHFQGFRHRFRPWFIVWLTVMWCLLMGDVSWANVFGGLAVGCLIVFLLPLPAMPVAGISISWGEFIRFCFRWVADLFYASVKVAWLAIRPQAPPKTAVLELPMRLENEFILSLAVTLYNLQPGGTVTDIDIANRMLTIHVLDADSDSHLEREVAAVARLEASLISIFERSHP